MQGSRAPSPPQSWVSAHCISSKAPTPLTCGPAGPGHGAAGRAPQHAPARSAAAPASPAGAAAAGCRLPAAAGTAAPPGTPPGRPGKTPCSSHTGTCWGPGGQEEGVRTREEAHPGQVPPKQCSACSQPPLLSFPSGWGNPKSSPPILHPFLHPMGHAHTHWEKDGKKHQQGMLRYHSCTPRAEPLPGAISPGQGCSSASHQHPPAPLCSPEPCICQRTPGMSTCGAQRGSEGCSGQGEPQGAGEAGGTWKGSLRH